MYIKGLFSLLIIGSLFSITSAVNTSKQGRDIINQLRNDGRTDKEIKATMEDLGFDPSGYFPTNSNNTTTNYSTTNHNTSNNTSKQGRDILNQLRAEGRTDKEIKNKMEDLGLDTSGYFPSSSNSTNSSSKTTQEGRDIINELRDEGWKDNEIKIMIKDLGFDADSYFGSSSSNNESSNESTYTSRSCKTYTINYMSNLGVYTSPDLKRTEYFINTDYFKRYIDSKNPQKSGCPVNGGYITTFYSDYSNNSDRFIAPNGKVYFITNQNGLYTSNELRMQKRFSSINELKNYIRDRNPLVRMGESSQGKTKSQNNTTNKNNSNNLTTIWNEIFN